MAKYFFIFLLCLLTSIFMSNWDGSQQDTLNPFDYYFSNERDATILRFADALMMCDFEEGRINDEIQYDVYSCVLHREDYY